MKTTTLALILYAISVAGCASSELRIHTPENGDVAKVVVQAWWIDLKALAEEGSTDVRSFPNLLFVVEEGGGQGSALRQGDVKASLTRGRSWEATFSIWLSNGEFPLSTDMAFSYVDNAGQQFELKKSMKILSPRSKIALRSDDGRYLVAILWRPYTRGSD